MVSDVNLHPYTAEDDDDPAAAEGGAGGASSSKPNGGSSGGDIVQPRKKQRRDKLFDEHLPQSSITAGIAAGRLHRGRGRWAVQANPG